MKEKQPKMTPEIVDVTESYNLEQLCAICQIEPLLVINMIEEGVVETSGATADDWKFTYSSVGRIQLAYRLHRDLNINLPGAALSVDLLEEIDQLRQQIQKLQQQLRMTE